MYEFAGIFGFIWLFLNFAFFREVVHQVVWTFFCVLVVLAAFVFWGYHYTDIQCTMGDKAACYRFGEGTLMPLTPEQQAMSTPLDQLPVGVGKRFSMLRTEWFNGAEVKTRMNCVSTMFPIPDERTMCLPRIIITGPYAGVTMPWPGDTAADASWRAGVTANVEQEWAEATW